MKTVLIALVFLLGVDFIQSQENPIQTVERFFEAMHAQDSIAFSEITTADMELVTSIKVAEGYGIRKTSFKDFFAQLKSLNKTYPKWEERLLDIQVNANESLANVWTDYVFLFDGEAELASHCGQNSFQLIKLGYQWKIVSVLDTRSSCYQMRAKIFTPENSAE